jgi:hypothetical protein
MPTPRRRRTPPPDFSDLTPNYPPGYLEHRRGEYELYDRLPAWARKVLQRTKHEYPVTQVFARIQRGDKPIDILSDLEHCERVLNQSYLEQFKLK